MRWRRQSKQLAELVVASERAEEEYLRKMEEKEEKEAPSVEAVRREEACLELMSEAVREERRRMEHIKEEMQRIKETLPDELELYIRVKKSKRAARSMHWRS